MANIPINLVKQRTPHAAVIIWNYEDRLGVEDTADAEVNKVQEKLLSTISLISISTKKSKGEPVGRFELNLAPTKNWVSEITSGSWMVILMSQNPITKADLANAAADKVKFFGKIESVRFNNYIIDPESGARGSGYTISGVDWAHIFENNVYIDPFIEKENNTIGSTTYIDLFERVRTVDDRASITTTSNLLTQIKDVLGLPIGKGIEEQANTVNRVAKVDYSFAVPPQVQTYFGFKNSANIVDSLKIITGKLVDNDQYEDAKEAFGWIDPSSFRGVHTFWQLFIDNSCPVLNETFTDMMWPTGTNTPVLAIYNRIKPFAYRATSETEQRIQKALTKEAEKWPKEKGQSQQQAADVVLAQVKNLMSKFQLLKTYDIPLEEIIAFDAGTNWRDKFNFAEIKPGWQNAELLANWIKTVAQTADVKAFQREGFRPLIMTSKQFPTFGPKSTFEGQPNDLGININVLSGWKQLLREWYFDTHRLLNGSMTIVGQSQYIQVGSNVRIPVDILGKTHNIKTGAGAGDVYLLAHVESINNSFTVSRDGARSFTSTITFVRGIIVSANGSPIIGGKLDNKVSDQTSSQYRNTNNVISTSTALNPNPRKNNGT